MTLLSLDDALMNPLEISDRAVVVMAWLTASYWLGTHANHPAAKAIGDQLLRLARGELDDADDRWIAGLGMVVESTLRSTAKPLPYHQLQLSISRDAVDVWITLAGYYVHRVQFPIGVDVDPMRFAVVMDLRSGRQGFNQLPESDDVHEAAWVLSWEAAMRDEVARAERRPRAFRWPQAGHRSTHRTTPGFSQ